MRLIGIGFLLQVSGCLFTTPRLNRANELIQPGRCELSGEIRIAAIAMSRISSDYEAAMLQKLVFAHYSQDAFVIDRLAFAATREFGRVGRKVCRSLTLSLEQKDRRPLEKAFFS